MSAHFGGSHFASSHYDSSHYGGVGISIIVPKGGVEDAIFLHRRKLEEEEREFITLLVMAVEVIERDRS